MMHVIAGVTGGEDPTTDNRTSLGMPSWRWACQQCFGACKACQFHRPNPSVFFRRQHPTQSSRTPPRRSDRPTTSIAPASRSRAAGPDAGGVVGFLTACTAIGVRRQLVDVQQPFYTAGSWSAARIIPQRPRAIEQLAHRRPRREPFLHIGHLGHRRRDRVESVRPGRRRRVMAPAEGL